MFFENSDLTNPSSGTIPEGRWSFYRNSFDFKSVHETHLCRGRLLLLQRYVQNTKVIYKKEFERFFEVINNELNRLANAERRATLKNLDSSKSSLERAFRTESKIDQKALINVSFYEILVDSKILLLYF